MTMSVVPTPAPIVHSATAAAFASLSIATGSPRYSRTRARSGTPRDRHVHREDGGAVALVDRRGDADADGGHGVVAQLVDHLGEAAQECFVDSSGVRPLDAHDGAVRLDDAGEDLRPADVDTDGAQGGHGGGYHNPPDGPRREAVSRLPRWTAKAQALRPSRRVPHRKATDGRSGPGAPAGRRASATAARRPAWLGVLSSSWLAAWSLAGYFSFRDGVNAANKRLPAAEGGSCRAGGLLLTNPTTILLLGTDTRPGRPGGLRHSDSIMLVRTDPDHHRHPLPLDPSRPPGRHPRLRDGGSTPRIQIGGPALALKTVKPFTGLDVDHVVVVDFARFKELIDSIGGIDCLRPPRDPLQPLRVPLLDAAGCNEWDGWRFEKGRQHMDGRRALVYSRIRENRLDPADNDITRGERSSRSCSRRSREARGRRDVPAAAVHRRRAAEATRHRSRAGDFLQLGWVKFRAGGGRVVQCRLGGSPRRSAAQSVIVRPRRTAVSRCSSGTPPRSRRRPARGHSAPAA